MPATADQPSQSPIVYADAEHGNEPICLDCFLRLRNEASDADAVKEWGEIQEIARSGWQCLPATIREEQGFEDPNGWAKFLLERSGWSRINGRCWACRQRLAIYYRLLVEEIQSEQKMWKFRADCKTAAMQANALALEVAASGYRPGVPILKPDHKYGHLPDLVAAHMASCRELLRKPDLPAVKILWSMLHRQLLKALDVDFSQALPDEKKYEPLTLSAQTLWKIAVVFRQMADVGSVVERNFAGFVRANAKDPNNLPERLALVAAYQEAQKLVPPMGYGELAKVLIEHEVVDGKWWGDDTNELQANIQRAVKKFRRLMPLRPYPYQSYQGQGGTTPP